MVSEENNNFIYIGEKFNIKIVYTFLTGDICEKLPLQKNSYNFL